MATAFLSFALTMVEPPMVKQVIEWGSWETFSSVPWGIHSNASFNDVTLHATKGIDVVVLDHWLYFASFKSAKGTVMTYSPSKMILDGYGWNISFETYPALNASGWAAWGKNGGDIELKVDLLNGDQRELVEVRMVTGDSLNDSISIGDKITGDSRAVANGTMAPTLEKSMESGGNPGRYIVSFECHYGKTECRIVIRHTIVGVLFVGNVQIPTADGLKEPTLRFDMDTTLTYEQGLEAGGWIVDNLATRSIFARYLLVEPYYEIVSKDEPIWVNVTDPTGNPVENAKVLVAGVSTAYNSTRERYERIFNKPADWSIRYMLNITIAQLHYDDSFFVTIKSSLNNSRETLPIWWNGWSWVSVAGRDDCFSPSEGLDTWKNYDHPVTCYLADDIGGGTSSNILPTQSEIGSHFPHDFENWPYMDWASSHRDSVEGRNFLSAAYEFASRWDDPMYVGTGGTFISMGNPGNGASMQMMLSQYANGMRIAGTSSDVRAGYAPSIIGSWILNPDNGEPLKSAWYPHTMLDLMNAQRQWYTGEDIPQSVVQSIAEEGGVLRMYNHRDDFKNPGMISWVVNNKIGFQYENWKATDGEVASYVYGLWTTDVRFDEANSTSGKWAYDISKRNPAEKGYWNVPITIAMNVTGRTIEDIVIKEGTRTYRMTDGSLKNLSGAREMDVGYDLRNQTDNAEYAETLFVSFFWNRSSSLEIVFNSTAGIECARSSSLGDCLPEEMPKGEDKLPEERIDAPVPGNETEMIENLDYAAIFTTRAERHRIIHRVLFCDLSLAAQSAAANMIESK